MVICPLPLMTFISLAVASSIPVELLALILKLVIVQRADSSAVQVYLKAKRMGAVRLFNSILPDSVVSWLVAHVALSVISVHEASLGCDMLLGSKSVE